MGQILLGGRNDLTTGSGANQPSQELVLRVLDTEINQINSDQQAGGWNTWALLGALAAALWLLLDLVGETSIQIAVVVHWLIALTFVRNLVVTIVARTSPGELPAENSDIRFFGAGKISGHWQSLLLDTIRASTLFGLALMFSEGVPLASLISAYLLLVSSILNPLFLLMMSRTQVLLPTKHTPALRFWPVFLILFSVCTLIAVYGYLQPVLPLAKSDIPVFRMAILIAAVIELIRLVLERSREPPLLQGLINMRRRLALGRISAAEAANSLEISLLGLRLDDVLQKDLQAVILAQQDFDTHNQRLRDLLEEMETGLAALQTVLLEGENEADDLLAGLEERLRAGEALLEVGRAQEGELLQTIVQFSKRLQWLAAGAPDVASEIKEIGERTVRSLHASKQQLDELAVRTQRLIGSLPETDPE